MLTNEAYDVLCYIKVNNGTVSRSQLETDFSYTEEEWAKLIQELIIHRFIVLAGDLVVITAEGQNYEQVPINENLENNETKFDFQ